VLPPFVDQHLIFVTTGRRNALFLSRNMPDALQLLMEYVVRYRGAGAFQPDAIINERLTGLHGLLSRRKAPTVENLLRRVRNCYCTETL
jgi:hypothetical protein